MAARLSAIVVAVIVGASVVAGLIVGAQRGGDGPVDLIVHNGRVYTGDPVSPFAEAVAIRGNQIINVGSNGAVKRLRRPQTTMLDAHGGAVLPAINDARLGLVEGGLSLDEADLSAVASPEDLQRELKAWADARPDVPWVRGRDLDCESVEAPVPRRLLDQIAAERPVYADCRGGSSGWANSAALGLTGAADPAPRPPEPDLATGRVDDAERRRIIAALPQPGQSSRLRAVERATARLHALGVTSVHDASPSAETLALYDDLRQVGELRLRIFASLPVEPDLSPADVAGLDAVRSRFADDPLLKLGAVRFTVDDTLTERDLERLVTMLDAHEWSVIATAKTDTDVRRTLDAYEHAALVNPVPAGGRRHRIEAPGAVQAEEAQRLSALGVVAVVGPDPASTERGSDGEPAEPAWMSLWRSRARFVFASNWPLDGLVPGEGLLAAVEAVLDAPTHEADDTEMPGPTIESVVDAHAAGVAYAAFDDHRKGLLANGMLADLVVLSTDVFAAPADRLSGTVVDATVFDGRLVYRRDDAERTEH